MLTDDEKARIEESIPLTQTIPYGGNSYVYELAPFWSAGDESGADATSTGEYPTLVFNLAGDGDRDSEREPIGGLVEIDEQLGEPGIIETERSSLVSELELTVAVEAVHDTNGVPAETRASMIARNLWRYVRRELGTDLEEPGDNDERPIVVEPNSTPTPARVDRTYRIEFSADLRYRETYDREIPTVDDVEYTADVEE